MALALLLSAAMVARAGAPASPPAISVKSDGPRNGPDVVLVSGLSSGPFVWDDLVRSLRTGHRVHVVTLESACSGSAGAAPLDEAADALQAFLSKLPRPATVVAHSAGGFVTLQLSLREPSAFRKLLIIDAVPALGMLLAAPGEGPAHVQAKAQAAFERTTSASGARRAAMLQQERMNAVQDPHHAHELTQAAIHCNPLTLAKATRDLMVADLRGDLPRAQVPLTVIFADQASHGAPPGWMRSKYEKLYAGYAGPLTLREVTGSRHYIMLDQPEQLRRIVEDAMPGAHP